jgi:hypothetical protein
MADTEQTIYVAVLVVEHAPGVGPELDEAPDAKNWATGVRANLVTWLDGVLTDEDARNEDGTLFYGVRDVTLYSADDLVAELRDHGSIDKFPAVNTNPTNWR